ARADDYPDALLGAPLAAAKDAPLLFSSGTTLPAETLAEIQRVLAPGGLVIILGGDSAVPASIAAQVNALGYAQVRYSGADRYATAVSVADALGDPKTVFLATGTNFPDALTAGPAATKTGDAILLTDGSALPATTSAYLAAHTGQQDYAVGGPAAAAYPSATPLVGADRYATALAVLGQFYSSPQTMGLASGASFADALAGGAFMSHVGGPLLLSDPNSLPSSVRTYLTENAPPLVSLSIFGGTSAVSSSVQTAVGVALGQ
ncbi:MAG TPA: cell wall-binding repeat-containing protein, partial [Acidothermaceae bacterium]|nr:cell wall-binding repeat-containing protein [Acidothermaceae bacterium]